MPAVAMLPIEIVSSLESVWTVPRRRGAVFAFLWALVSCGSDGSDDGDVGAAGGAGGGGAAAGGGAGTAGGGGGGGEAAAAGTSAAGAAGSSGADLGEPTLTFTDYSAARYCEVLVARAQGDGTLVADVYNSLALGDCPQDLWDALDVAQIESDFPNATLVALNGPRFFLMQEIYGSDVTPRGVHDFGGIRMVLVATVELDPGRGTAYTDTSVQRTTTFRFKSGVRVYELLSPGGAQYVMQSFSRIEDPDLAFEELDTLGERLAPPDGWTYRTRVLDADFDVTATGVATIVTDELKNTYQLVE